jgi:uncharacterized protein
MVIGIGVLELMVHNSSSLKAKRQAIKSILGKTRSKFDLSIAEVGDQDKWQRSTIAFAVVSNESGHAHNMLETIANYIENLYLAEVVDTKIEILHY